MMGKVLDSTCVKSHCLIQRINATQKWVILAVLSELLRHSQLLRCWDLIGLEVYHLPPNLCCGSMQRNEAATGWCAGLEVSFQLFPPTMPKSEAMQNLLTFIPQHNSTLVVMTWVPISEFRDNKLQGYCKHHNKISLHDLRIFDMFEYVSTR